MELSNIEEYEGLFVDFSIEKNALLSFLDVQLKQHILQIEAMEFEGLKINVNSVCIKELVWQGKFWTVSVIVDLALFKDGWLIDVDSTVTIALDVVLDFLRDDQELVKFSISKYEWLKGPSISIARIDFNVDTVVNYFLEKKMPRIIADLNNQFNAQLKSILSPSFVGVLIAQEMDVNGNIFHVIPVIKQIQLKAFSQKKSHLKSSVFAHGQILLSTHKKMIHYGEESSFVDWMIEKNEKHTLTLKTQLSFVSITKMINDFLPVLDLPALGKLKMSARDLQIQGKQLSFILETSGATNGEFKLDGKVVHDLSGLIGIEILDIEIIKLSSFKKMAFLLVEEKIKKEINLKTVSNTKVLQQMANDQLMIQSQMIKEKYFVIANCTLKDLRILWASGENGQLHLEVKAESKISLELTDPRFYGQFESILT